MKSRRRTPPRPLGRAGAVAVPRRRASTNRRGKAASADARDIERARRVLAIEAAAIRRAAQRLDPDFSRAVGLVAGCRGKVVVTGLGKSGQVCRKIASTLASTGTPSFFLHASEGLHGDLGMLMKDDVVLALSYSGETEVVQLLPAIKRLALPLIALTGKVDSTLGRAADVVLDASVGEEACPMGLAPTASTTVALALGDALAVAALERKQFRADDFAVLHPGGNLGRRLLRIGELTHTGEQLPLVPAEASLAETLREMSQKRLGITGVVNAAGDLVGVVTDGDLRRALETRGDVGRCKARDLMTSNPKTVPIDALAEQALATMERHSITSLFVLDERGRRPVGVIHMHDLLRAGVV